MRTRACWLEGFECTEVWFDPRTLSFEQLLVRGDQQQCAQQVWTTTAAQFEVASRRLGDGAHRLDVEPRPDREPKYYLAHTAYRFVPMTATQAARVNADLAPGSKVSPRRWLSPRQLAVFERAEVTKGRGFAAAIDAPMIEAWAKLPER